MNVGTVAEAVTTLYGGDPADFVAVRKELAAAARTAGERDAAREIAALRKPTAAAAAVNHLDDGAISDVLALGEQMRAAQTSLDAATLKELSARPKTSPRAPGGRQAVHTLSVATDNGAMNPARIAVAGHPQALVRRTPPGRAA